jgi:spermidine synthase
MLSLSFGATVFAISTVLTSFMAGLALGSYYFGKFVDRYKEPLKLYAYLEFGIGVSALTLPLLLSGVTQIYIQVYRQVHASFYIFSLFRFILSFIVLLIPTVLMGATLPAISKFFVQSPDKIGWDVGRLYAVNVFGAVIGTVVAGFFSINAIGVMRTTLMAALLNGLVGLIALLINVRAKHLRASASSLPQPQPQPQSQSQSQSQSIREYSPFVVRLAIVAYAISGFCALAYEVFWSRTLSFFLGNTVYGFTAMLSAFLCGLALGSAIFSAIFSKRKRMVFSLGLAQMLIGISAILVLLSFRHLYSINARFSQPTWFNFIFGRFILAFIVMSFPTMLMGGVFPLVMMICAKEFEKLGKYVGRAYSANTLGAIFGAFVAGFILVPIFGVQRSIIIVAFVNIIIGFLVAVVGAGHASPIKLSWAKQFASPLQILPVLLLTGAISTPFFISTDQSLVLLTALFRGLPGNNLLSYKEGVEASVTVSEGLDQIRRIFVGTNQAADNSRWDSPSHRMIAHVPLLLHPAPKTALVVGFGMGVTSRSITTHNVKVDAVEISPEVVEASKKFFSETTKDIHSDPRLNLIIDDGRNYVLATNKKYDMISTGIIHPLVSSGSAGFYTLDFYKQCKKILTPNGIMSQWVPLHRLPEKSYKMIVRSFKAAFPHTTLWYKYTPDFVILLGTPEKLKVDFQNFAKRIEPPEIKRDLAEVDMDDAITILDSFMMDEDTVFKYAGQGELHTDDQPQVEFYGPKDLMATTYDNVAGMFPYRQSVIPYIAGTTASDSDLEKLKVAYEATQHVIKAQLFELKGEFRAAELEYQIALKINPNDKNARYLVDAWR